MLLVTRLPNYVLSLTCHIHTLVGFLVLFFFFFNDTATTEIYTLSLHDALPICRKPKVMPMSEEQATASTMEAAENDSWKLEPDRKSTRLNSSHANISYAVFCLKKKNTGIRQATPHRQAHSVDHLLPQRVYGRSL